MLDPDRHAVRYANCCACSLLGYNIDELLALPIFAVFSADRRALEAFLAATVKQGHASTTTVGLRARSGEPLAAELLAFRFRRAGQGYVLVLANTRGSDGRHPI